MNELITPEARSNISEEVKQSRTAAIALSLTIIGISGGIATQLREIPSGVLKPLIIGFLLIAVAFAVLLQYFSFIGQKFHSQMLYSMLLWRDMGVEEVGGKVAKDFIVWFQRSEWYFKWTGRLAQASFWSFLTGFVLFAFVFITK